MCTIKTARVLKSVLGIESPNTCFKAKKRYTGKNITGKKYIKL
jgi:hypothetical protein